jgi:hypothetical protein
MNHTVVQNTEPQGKTLVKSFESVLGTFNDAKGYKSGPPKGPPDELPTLTDEELKALKLPVFQEDRDNGGAYKEIKLVEDPAPIEVKLPTATDLEDVNICGIDGSNQRVERSSFYFILARAAIVEFRYSTKNAKPYFYTRTRNAGAVTWVDGNVFTESIKLFTKTPAKQDDTANILKDIEGLSDSPLLVRYDPDKVDKSPSSHALGWAVKLQQALELLCIKDVPTNTRTICIKDGPLFSTSVSPADTKAGLAPIFGWKDQVLIACSKRVKDSSLLVEALLGNQALREHWFPNQNLSDVSLKAVATDSLLLPRILKPGFRTPLMAAVPIARQQIVNEDPRLMPLSCYYLSRHRPHTYIRVEIPQFMYEQNKDIVDEAISLVAWQHELGHRAPLVQLAADNMCQLQAEKLILEKQTTAALLRQGLEFPEEY